MKKEQFIELRAGYTKNTIEVHTDYNPEFIAGIKKLSGVWEPDEKAWIVKQENIEAVRDLATKVFGCKNFTTRTITLPRTMAVCQPIPGKMNVRYYEVNADRDEVRINGCSKLPEGAVLTWTFA